MEINDINLELRFLKTITSGKTPKRKRLELLGKVNEHTFHHPFTQQAYKRIMSLVQNRNHLLDWNELKTDNAIEKDARDLFIDSKAKPAKGTKSANKLIEDLDIFRKRRQVFELINDTADKYDDGDSIDIDQIIENIRGRVGQIEANTIEEETVWSFGEDDNGDEILERTLTNPGEEYYKTGFKEYDERNGGLPTHGVMIMAATTSGGKSAVSMNLERNLAQLNQNMRASKITLEMSEEQEMKRILSMVSGVPLNKFKRNELSEREEKKVRKDFKEWRKKLKENNSRFSFVSGKKARTIDQLLAWMVPYQHKVIIIDYISLLEGVDDDNQWRMLSAIARKCKVFSAEHNCLIILLAQLDTESSKLRYSKGIKEHADVMWKWNYADEEVRATKVITIQIDKVRDGELFDMPVSEDFATMTIKDPDDEALEIYEELKASRKNGNKKRGSKSEDEEEDDKRSKKRKRNRDVDEDKPRSKKRKDDGPVLG